MRRNRFFAMWLGFGLMQLVLAAGCGRALSDGALSSTPSTGNEQVEASGSAGGHLILPLRLSRAFFEKSLQGSFQITGQDGKSIAQSDSQVSWNELPPTDPAPTGDYLADFRDFQGCAAYRGASGLQLCFTVSPDVSSVPLSAEKLQLRGIVEVLESSGHCSNETPAIRFIGAVKSENSVQVKYEADYPTCAAARIDLMLRSV